MLAARKIRAETLIIAEPCSRSGAGRHRAENGSAKVAGTDRSGRGRGARPRRLSSDPPLQGHHAGSDRDAHYDPPGTFSNACHVAIVDVDIETGRVVMEKYSRRRGRRPHHQSDDRGRPGARRRRARHRQRVVRGNRLRRPRQYPDRDARRLPAADAREIPRSNCTTSKRRPTPPLPAPKAWAKAALSARRRPSSTPSTMRFRRSASRSTKCRRPHSGSARRFAPRRAEIGNRRSPAGNRMTRPARSCWADRAMARRSARPGRCRRGPTGIQRRE